MASVNKVILVGNLGADVELRETASGKSVGNVSLATKQGDDTEWHKIVVWDKTAENMAKYTAKGSSVYVEGRLQTRSWEDDNGNKRYATEIVAHLVQFLGSKKQDAESDF